MSCQSVEAVFSNADLILELYEHLDFQSQLRLSRVNVLLDDVFKTYLWKETYETVNIFERGQDFIVTNETDVNRLSLKFEELQEFLNIYAYGVKKLNLRNIILDPEKYGHMAIDITHGHMILRNQINMRHFKNLKSLTYHFMVIPLDHMRLVAELYPGLEELSLTNCSQGNDIYGLLHEVLPQLKNLKSLCVQDFIRFSLKFRQFQELVHQGNLETLKVTAVLEPDDSLPYLDDSVAPPDNLKQLQIQATFDPQRWSNNFSTYLRYFSSLTMLDLEVLEKINDKTLTILAAACKELKQLHIRFSFFDHIQQFVMPPKVRELSLNWCRGLTHLNLQQMLTELQITKFASKDTAYEGEFISFCVSPLIESLHVDAIFTEGFQFTSATNNLNELTWYYPWSTDGLLNAVSLDPCRNLQKLYIHEGQLSLDTLMQLGSLEKLTIPHPVPLLTWSYITRLLTHSNLKDLTIRSFCSYRYSYQRMEVGVPSEAVTTNITDLEIPLDIFDVAIIFWLKLFRRNRNFKRLSCIFYPYEKYDEFLLKLVNHAKFPRAIRTIDVCGFTLNCNHLRKRSADHLEKLRNQTDNTKCWHDNDVYRIIIQKKN